MDAGLDVSRDLHSRWALQLPKIFGAVSSSLISMIYNDPFELLCRAFAGHRSRPLLIAFLERRRSFVAWLDQASRRSTTGRRNLSSSEIIHFLRPRVLSRPTGSEE